MSSSLPFFKATLGELKGAATTALSTDIEPPSLDKELKRQMHKAGQAQSANVVTIEKPESEKMNPVSADSSKQYRSRC